MSISILQQQQTTSTLLNMNRDIIMNPTVIPTSLQKHFTEVLQRQQPMKRGSNGFTMRTTSPSITHVISKSGVYFRFQLILSLNWIAVCISEEDRDKYLPDPTTNNPKTYFQSIMDSSSVLHLTDVSCYWRG
jgi:hypothetical protein